MWSHPLTISCCGSESRTVRSYCEGRLYNCWKWWRKTSAFSSADEQYEPSGFFICFIADGVVLESPDLRVFKESQAFFVPWWRSIVSQSLPIHWFLAVFIIALSSFLAFRRRLVVDLVHLLKKSLMAWFLAFIEDRSLSRFILNQPGWFLLCFDNVFKLLSLTASASSV